MNDQLNKH
uniref:Uncharacterized protein n=1 Tax=Arundo donax TaxID=35708 RepID=A0A0A9AJB9_ARUDO